MERSKLVGGSLILAGTALGAGMLALPVVTAQAGFLPSVLVYFLCWVFSVCTGLLFVEICLWMPQDANIISMATHLLGKFGKWVAWGLYIFLFYSLTVAYISGGGKFVSELFHLPLMPSSALFALAFGSFVVIGTRAVDRINFLLMIGLVLAFVGFIAIGLPKVRPALAMRFHLAPAFMALPILFTSFSYQGTVPSIVAYFERDGKAARKAILIGTAIPFAAYIIWQFLILGIIPLSGTYGLLAAKKAQDTAVTPLKYMLADSPIYPIGNFFSFFALTTSFLGVSLGLMDFMADGLKIAKKGIKKLGLAALIFVPPLLITWVNPHVFLTALGLAGGIGCALLLGLLPIVMVWKGRYQLDYSTLHQMLPGGKKTLMLLGAFVILELVITLLNHLQYS